MSARRLRAIPAAARAALACGLGGAALSAAGALGSGAGAAACARGYEPPCAVGEPRTVLDVGAGPEGSVVSGVSIGDDGAGGMVVSIVRSAAPDPDAGPAAPRVPGLPSSVEIVRVRADGSIAERRTFDAPAELAGRHGSTAPLAVSWTGAGVLFQWLETAQSTAPDGVVSTSAAYETAFVGADGRKSAVFAPAVGTCSACRVAISTATAGGITLAVVTKAPDGSAPAAPAAPSEPVLVRFSPEGALLSADTPPWLARARGGASGAGAGAGAGAGGGDVGGAGAAGLGGGAVAGAAPPAVAGENGTFFFFDGGKLTIVDPSLAILAGPLLLPPGAAGAAVDWDAASRELELAYTSNGVPGGDAGAGAGAGAIRTGLDVFLERLASDGRPLTRAERVASANQILELRRRDGRVGVIVGGTGAGEAFALADDSGRKIGGNVELPAPAAVPGPAAGSGEVASLGSFAARHRLVANGPRGRFVDWMVRTSGVTVREISCDR